jgi:hypothetical protein
MSAFRGAGTPLAAQVLVRDRIDSSISADVRIFPELGYILIGLSNLDPPAAERVL